MHLHISVLLLFTLLTRGFCLECSNCYGDPNCNEKMTCDSKTARCGSSKEVAYVAGRKVSDVSTGQSCIEPRECRSWSMTILFLRKKQTIRCCDTDLCNGAQPDLKWNPQPNGKECYTCDWEDCSQTVKCQGDEDRCFTSYVTDGVFYKGCISEFACEIPGKVFGPGVNITCCDTNNCNKSDP